MYITQASIGKLKVKNLILTPPKVPGKQEQNLPAQGEEDMQKVTEEVGPGAAAFGTTLESDISPFAKDSTESMDTDQ